MHTNHHCFEWSLLSHHSHALRHTSSSHILRNDGQPTFPSPPLSWQLGFLMTHPNSLFLFQQTNIFVAQPRHFGFHLNMRDSRLTRTPTLDFFRFSNNVPTGTLPNLPSRIKLTFKLQTTFHRPLPLTIVQKGSRPSFILHLPPPNGVRLPLAALRKHRQRHTPYLQLELPPFLTSASSPS